MHSLFAPHHKAPGDPHFAAPGSTITRFTNCRLLIGHELRKGQDLWVRDGSVADPKQLFWEGRSADTTIDCEGRILAPGFIDLQVVAPGAPIVLPFDLLRLCALMRTFARAQLNGAFGADFCIPEPGLEAGLRLCARRLVEFGVTAFLPTVITSSLESYRAILPKIVPTPASRDLGSAVLGVHLEGPFISPEKPGCHPIEHIRDADGQPDALRRACGSTAYVKMVTLAPERPGAMACIAELVAQGVVVSAGHSTATAAQMDAAQDAGVTMVTHLFNAMPAFHPREPGIIGVLGSTPPPRSPFFGLIADGVHVHPASIKLAHQVRPRSVVLVSDAMVAMGLPAGTYQFGGDAVEVTPDGRAVRPGTETLAGAVVPLDECMRRFRKFTGCTIVEALEAASLHPAQALGIDARKGTLEVGADADFVLLDDELQVRATYLQGEQVWPLAEGAKPVGPLVHQTVADVATPQKPAVDEAGAKRRRIAAHS